MKFSTEEHLSMAKLLRRQAALIIGPTREKTIAMSNTFLRLAAKAAKHRGEISILEFDFEGLFPDWAVIDSQIERLKPVNTPPAKAGGFRLRLKAGLVRPLADSDGGCASSYLEIIVRFGRCLVLDIFGPYLIGNVSAAGDPISSAP